MKRAPRILPTHDRRLKFAALFWVATVRLALLMFQYAKVVDWQRRVARPRKATSADAFFFERVEHAIERTARFVPGARCLARALAGQILLGRRGIAVELRLGVARRSEETLVAHAWLEQDGRVVLGAQEDEDFTVLRDARNSSR